MSFKNQKALSQKYILQTKKNIAKKLQVLQ